MSSLTAADKLYLEKILEMDGGYVLKFSDATFKQLFNRYSVDIHGDRYQTYGRSKAKKMHAFWEQESDTLVAHVLSEMVDTYEALCDSGSYERDAAALRKSREIVARISGKSLGGNSTTDDGFLSKEFEIPSTRKLPVDFVVAQIIEDRLRELQITLSNQGYLSAIFLCGSVLEGVLLGAAQQQPVQPIEQQKSRDGKADFVVAQIIEDRLRELQITLSNQGYLSAIFLCGKAVLEGVLLGAAQQQPEKFNRSNSSPKSRDGKVKQFPDWSLSRKVRVGDFNLIGGLPV